MSNHQISNDLHNSDRNVNMQRDGVLELWKCNVARYLSEQSQNTSPQDIIANVGLPPILPKSSNLLEILKEDEFERFHIVVEDNVSKIKSNFKLNDMEIERLKSEWREGVSKYLSAYTSAVSLNEIAAHVTKPFYLPPSITLLDILQTDAKGRFILSGEADSMRARRIFYVDEEEILCYVDEWRETIINFLSYQKSSSSLSDIGSSVPRPKKLPISVKLIDVLKSDTQGRIILTGEGNHIRAHVKHHMKAGAHLYTKELTMTSSLNHSNSNNLPLTSSSYDMAYKHAQLSANINRSAGLSGYPTISAIPPDSVSLYPTSQHISPYDVAYNASIQKLATSSMELPSPPSSQNRTYDTGHINRDNITDPFSAQEMVRSQGHRTGTSSLRQSPYYGHTTTTSTPSLRQSPYYMKSRTDFSPRTTTEYTLRSSYGEGVGVAGGGGSGSISSHYSNSHSHHSNPYYGGGPPRPQSPAYKSDYSSPYDETSSNPHSRLSNPSHLPMMNNTKHTNMQTNTNTALDVTGEGYNMPPYMTNNNASHLTAAAHLNTAASPTTTTTTAANIIHNQTLTQNTVPLSSTAAATNTTSNIVSLAALPSKIYSSSELTRNHPNYPRSGHSSLRSSPGYNYIPSTNTQNRNTDRSSSNIYRSRSTGSNHGLHNNPMSDLNATKTIPEIMSTIDSYDISMSGTTSIATRRKSFEKYMNEQFLSPTDDGQEMIPNISMERLQVGGNAVSSPHTNYESIIKKDNNIHVDSDKLDSMDSFMHKWSSKSGHSSSKAFSETLSESGGGGLIPNSTTISSNTTATHVDPALRELICPLTKTLMREPVIALDGVTYEKEAILIWLSRNHNSPITHKVILDRTLIPNEIISTKLKYYHEQQQQQKQQNKQILHTQNIYSCTENMHSSSTNYDDFKSLSGGGTHSLSESSRSLPTEFMYATHSLSIDDSTYMNKVIGTSTSEKLPTELSAYQHQPDFYSKPMDSAIWNHSQDLSYTKYDNKIDQNTDNLDTMSYRSHTSSVPRSHASSAPPDMGYHTESYQYDSNIADVLNAFDENRSTVSQPYTLHSAHKTIQITTSHSSDIPPASDSWKERPNETLSRTNSNTFTDAKSDLISSPHSSVVSPFHTYYDHNHLIEQLLSATEDSTLIRSNSSMDTPEGKSTTTTAAAAAIFSISPHMLLSEWLPIVFHGYDAEFITKLLTQMKDDLGFITVKDLLDAYQKSQLTYEFLHMKLGLKLGHYNRLINGLSAIKP